MTIKQIKQLKKLRELEKKDWKTIKEKKIKEGTWIENTEEYFKQKNKKKLDVKLKKQLKEFLTK